MYAVAYQSSSATNLERPSRSTWRSPIGNSAVGDLEVLVQANSQVASVDLATGARVARLSLGAA